MSTREELTLEGAAEMTTTADGVFKVDGAKCLKCGLCVEDCAFGALRTDDSRTPVMAKPDACMRCQHCLAVCPAGAVTFDGIVPEQCVSTDRLELPGFDAAANWLRTRRSMRRSTQCSSARRPSNTHAVYGVTHTPGQFTGRNHEKTGQLGEVVFALNPKGG